MPLVIDGRQVPVPGLQSCNFTEDARYALKLGTGWRPRRTRWVRSIGIHTRLGLSVKPILSPKNPKGRSWDEVFARRMNADGARYAGAHIAVDDDGSFACIADCARAAAYHAGHMNEVSVGIEMYQDTDGSVTSATLEATVILCDVLTRELGIQRQTVLETGHLARLASTVPGTSAASRAGWMKGGRAGADFVGVWGHRNATRNRGMGDPGSPIFGLLASAGYEVYRVERDQDLAVWAERQKALGVDDDDIDGIPGPSTRKLLVAAGYPHGIWVPRPGD